MKFCQPHWEKLQDAIAAKGLGALVADTGEEAAVKTRRQMEGEDSIDSFEPLLHAHNVIAGNAMSYIRESGASPLYLMADDATPEDPVVGYPGHEGKTWSRCPVCYINLAHEVSCDGKCELPEKDGFDWMIARGADAALEHWEELRP